MTLITGREPQHWHTETGQPVRHNMTDPRTVPGYTKTHWNSDERAFVAHLEEHERRAVSAEPLDTDHELVRTYLQLVATQQKILDGMRDLVFLLREELATGVPIEESAVAKQLKSFAESGVWPRGGPTSPQVPEEVVT